MINIYAVCNSDDGEPIAIIEACDYDFIQSWAEVYEDKTLEEFSTILSKSPNSQVGVDVVNLYARVYTPETLVRDVFPSKE